jgi:hypothetical protein
MLANWNRPSNLIRQVRNFLEVDMLANAIQAFSELRELTLQEQTLLEEGEFRRDFKEIKHELDHAIREQIEEAYYFYRSGRIDVAHDHAMNLRKMLEIEPNLWEFSEYLVKLRELLRQIEAENLYSYTLSLIDQHKLEKAREQLSVLREKARPNSIVREKIEKLYDELRGITHITLIPTETDKYTEKRFEKLTAQHLEKDISPFLSAISEIQQIFNEILGREDSKITIKVISQNSPIGVSLEGISDTVLVIADLLNPWKRKHAKKMAELSRREKRYEIEKKRIELQEANIKLKNSSIENQAAKMEVERSSAEVAKMRAEAEKLKIENEKARLELRSSKIKLALDIVERFANDLSETKKLSYMVQVLPHLDTLTKSDYNLVKK